MITSADTGGNAADERDLVLDAVLGPATEAYYSERVRSGSGARIRAQAAQSTVTLFAGGIVAALTFTQLADSPPVTRWAGVAAVALWLLSAVLYLRAVAQPVSSLASGDRARDRLDLLDKVLRRADYEASQVDRRQRHANVAVCAALVASVVTFALATFVEPETETARGVVVVSPSFAEQSRALCPRAAARIAGRIDEASVGSPFLRVTVSGRECGPGSTDIQLVIPRAAVLAIALKGE
ncbi:hypothetical protein ACIQU5_26595 [Streptomyces sp. NPDC090306]|uniref:hypothetical protein n=1 Tax=Streptomyces sp. NPDC090306 TaxID=3365961 RepID=UPI0037FB4C40